MSRPLLVEVWWLGCGGFGLELESGFVSSACWESMVRVLGFRFEECNIWMRRGYALLALLRRNVADMHSCVCPSVANMHDIFAHDCVPGCLSVLLWCAGVPATVIELIRRMDSLCVYI